jgi:hypothetical protein
VWETIPQRGIDKSTVSAPTFAQWQTQNNAFEQMAIYDADTHVLTNAGEPERIPSAQVSPNFFPCWGFRQYSAAPLRLMKTNRAAITLSCSATVFGNVDSIQIKQSLEELWS